MESTSQVASTENLALPPGPLSCKERGEQEGAATANLKPPSLHMGKGGFPNEKKLLITNGFSENHVSTPVMKKLSRKDFIRGRWKVPEIKSCRECPSIWVFRYEV